MLWLMSLVTIARWVGGNKTLCKHKGESFYLVTTQSIKKMMVIVMTMMVIVILRKQVPCPIQKGAQTLGFHFRQTLELFCHHWIFWILLWVYLLDFNLGHRLELIWSLDFNFGLRLEFFCHRFALFQSPSASWQLAKGNKQTEVSFLFVKIDLTETGAKVKSFLSTFV